MAEIGNKITDYPISSTISNTDKVFSNVGGALKQVTKETLLAEINSGLIELKMLGWNVPKECPIQNEVNGNTFIQKVGRVDLGSLSWTYSTTRFVASLPLAKSGGDYVKPSGYSDIYTSGTYNDVVSKDLIWWVSSGKNISLSNSSYTDALLFKSAMQGVYLYFELDNEIVMTDGEEVTEQIKADLKGQYTYTGNTDASGRFVFTNVSGGRSFTADEFVSCIATAPNYAIALPYNYSGSIVGVRVIDCNSGTAMASQSVTVKIKTIS